MKNKIELTYDDKNNEEVKKEIGYMRLLIAIIGGCNIQIQPHNKHSGRPRKIPLDKRAFPEKLMV